MCIRGTFLLLSSALALVLLCARPAPASVYARHGPAPPAARAKWTIMLYMNADNDLDPYALMDFEEMAAVKYSSRVNVVVQLDRYGSGNTDAQWGETRRFLLRQNLKPTRSNSFQGFEGEANMGDPATLEAFVAWARKSFPAERYMLVIWSHGDGWRRPGRETSGRRGGPDAQERERAVNSAEELLTKGLLTDDALASLGLEQTPLSGQYRTVSADETNNHDPLYVREIQDALESALGGGARLDVVGFDSCLMQMLETGYALRNVADVMVGSEELEPIQGWSYGDWLQTLVDTPNLDGSTLGKLLVESYRKTYDATTSDTTLSAIRLSGGGLNRLVGAVSLLSRELMNSLDAEWRQIRDARSGCNVFAPRRGYHGVDLHRFASDLTSADVNPRLRAKAARVTRLLELLVIQNYAGRGRQDAFGGRGLSIYFPASKVAYWSDRYWEAYTETNKKYVVQFVTDHLWDNFLHAYFERV
jgi:Clostripain family